MSLEIAVIGYGEVGQLFASELAAKPGVRLAAYDILFDEPGTGEALSRRAAAEGIRVGASTAEACRGSRLVISAVTADRAIEAARQAGPHLDGRQIYIDLNSVSPTTKRSVAAEACRSGTGFVEFAVMAPVADLGIAVPILAGGAGAEQVADILNPLGMRITPVGAEIGVASATKLCRSIVIKGMEALIVDFSLAAEKAGVMPAVLASLQASYPGLDWREIADTMPSRVRRHGVRRAAEMREAGRMLEELGLDGRLAEAIADRQETFARAARSERSG